MGVDKERIDTMAKETKTQKIERMMRVYKCSYEEALQLILDDEATDRGVLHEWNLTKEQEKALRKARQADREVKQAPKEKVKKERKQDIDKRDIIDLIAGALGEVVDNVNITNQEREIELVYKTRKFKIVLSVPRK